MDGKEATIQLLEALEAAQVAYMSLPPSEIRQTSENS